MSAPLSPLDAASAAMQADPSDERARLRFHALLLDADLHLVLEREAENDRLEPVVISADGGAYVLAFDRPERMAAFLRSPAPYAALPGRSLVGLLAEQSLGIALNPGTSPHPALIGTDAVAWLAGFDRPAAGTDSRTPVALFPPAAVPDALWEALARWLAGPGSRIEAAHLATAEYADGSRRMLLALTGVPEAEQGRATERVAEAVRFAGTFLETLELVFLPSDAPVLARLTRVAVRLDLHGSPAMGHLPSA